MEPRCSKPRTGFTDARGAARFRAKSRSFEKSIPLTCEEGIDRRISSGFRENRRLRQTAKQVFGNRNPLRCFHHEKTGGFYEHQINKKAKAEELEALLGKYVPGAEALRTKLKKYDAAYKALTAENAALEKQLGAASKESILKKLEINEKLRELDELHRMVDGIPPEILQAAKQVAAHKQQER